jgi:integrase
MTLLGDLQLPNDCVIHSLRHTFLTRFGEAGADAFTIKKVAGHSSVTISERYIHPTPEGQERAFERFANLNQKAVEGQKRRGVTTISATVLADRP